MKTELKKEFKDKLVMLGVYDQFTSNFELQKKKLTIDDLNDCDNFKDLVAVAFIWANTPEKADFWHNISNS